ncbi:hypothetical protein, conserved, partial [Eimeria tenella]
MELSQSPERVDPHLGNNKIRRLAARAEGPRLPAANELPRAYFTLGSRGCGGLRHLESLFQAVESVSMAIQRVWGFGLEPSQQVHHNDATQALTAAPSRLFFKAAKAAAGPSHPQRLDALLGASLGPPEQETPLADPHGGPQGGPHGGPQGGAPLAEEGGPQGGGGAPLLRSGGPPGGERRRGSSGSFEGEGTETLEHRLVNCDVGAFLA